MWNSWRKTFPIPMMQWVQHQLPHVWLLESRGTHGMTRWCLTRKKLLKWRKYTRPISNRGFEKSIYMLSDVEIKCPFFFHLSCPQFRHYMIYQPIKIKCFNSHWFTFLLLNIFSWLTSHVMLNLGFIQIHCPLVKHAKPFKTGALSVHWVAIQRCSSYDRPLTSCVYSNVTLSPWSCGPGSLPMIPTLHACSPQSLRRSGWRRCPPPPTAGTGSPWWAWRRGSRWSRLDTKTTMTLIQGCDRRLHRFSSYNVQS